MRIDVAIVHITLKIQNADVIKAWELDVSPHSFCYRELKKASKGFRDEELLGFGGFGRVYKGVPPNTNTEDASYVDNSRQPIEPKALPEELVPVDWV
ncbi:hypothetical protein MLD38_024146 [Melastoma candidum]|uniref:Uncharacterized protein n=1 Tax=Melastoma candidum TaxID=119954 RepID=A0ACB9NSE5_9MYRT|nr:hypothetical protein MLD38_024146 [Melastoma candidum]